MKNRNIKISELNRKWDLIIIGGGITGAGIFNEASKNGLHCLLLEQKDFGWGTSSRSGKLVHGGLRYLKQGQIRLTWHSVRERERLLHLYEGIVEAFGFIIPTIKKDLLSKLILKSGLNIYNLIALNWNHKYLDEYQLSMAAPVLKGGVPLSGGFNFLEARTDDARLVLQIIKEGERFGGLALNYFVVQDLIKNKMGKITAVMSKDLASGEEMEIKGRVIISATGAWTDKIRSQIGKKPRMRLLRGSHLIFPNWRVPVSQAIMLTHPADKRPLYIFPWEGVSLLGTTDIDHDYSLNEDPLISAAEGSYLLEAANYWLPSLNLSRKDAISTFSGVRPVINTGKKDPSRESRDYAIWVDNGLISVTGGKFTTFKLLARDVLKEVKKILPLTEQTRKSDFLYKGNSLQNIKIDAWQLKRLWGRFGNEIYEVLKEANETSLERIKETEILWTELRWAALNENVVHLDDLLLRRTRLGLLVSKGGALQMEKIKTTLKPYLQWDDKQWESEILRYLSLWEKAYSPDLIN